MVIWGDDVGLTIALEVYGVIILINGIIWNSYGSVERGVSDQCCYYSHFPFIIQVCLFLYSH